MTDSSPSASSRSIRIGCASGFWGDTNTAAFQLVKMAKIDYLVFDYLSEITMSIMARAMMKDPATGYATDFVTRVMAPLIKDIADKKIKVVSNAGGVNPLACRDALNKVIADAGLNLKVAVVLGDDLVSRQQEFRDAGTKEMFSGTDMPPTLASMNAYLGGIPIRDALAAGADIVITGRVVDSAVVVGPLLHEFAWSLDDYDKLAQASLAGHVIECGAQCTGGNFTDWDTVPGYENMGFPIAEVSADASFIITKPDNTGGLISVATISEQIVYEIGDPQSYLLPDVTADFSHVVLEQVGENRVKVSGARGRAPTDSYKVSATYPDGHRVIVSFMIGGMDAKKKGERVAEAILTKCERVLAMRGAPPFTGKSVEIIGTEATYGPHGRHHGSREVVVKIAVTHMIKEACLFFTSEIAQASTGMAPGLAGIFGGRPKASPVIRLFSTLVPKQKVVVEIDLDGKRQRVEIPGASAKPAEKIPAGKSASLSGTEIEVPLVQLAWGRSGDKGNASNIGVIARKAEYLPWIRASVTEASVAAYMAHVLDGSNSIVTRFELPGLNALNFLLTNALGGGGIASLRIDPQGKAFAQQLLEIPVKIPADLIK
jgi:hypothetical protein